MFFYFIVFMLAVEFVMLFWMQSSLNTAAQQVARFAASDISIPLNAEGIRQRCQKAIREIGILPPGYSAQMKNELQAYQTGQIAYDDSYESNEGSILRSLYANGLQQPTGAFDQGEGPQYSGCFALVNSKTSQINFFVVLHKSNAWPLFVRTLFIRGKWLDGRASYPAQALQSNTNLFVSQSGFSNNQALNRSILSVGARPFLRCAAGVTDCNDEAYVAANGVCNTGPNVPVPNARRPKRNVLKVGDGIWVTDRRGSSNSSNSRIGIDRILNCGNIDPLVLLGIRYDCRVDVTPSSGSARNNLTSLNSSYTCGDFVEYRNVNNGYQASFNGLGPEDQTILLNPINDPTIIRRSDPNSSRIDFLCKSDAGFLVFLDNFINPIHNGNCNSNPSLAGTTITYTVNFRMRSQIWTSSTYTAFNPLYLQHTCRHLLERTCPS
ncbi:MAG: TadE family protein [Candidatus Caenarcaniphilales bacterium]|nr:TadE family protein [Candidatus Caenarcaniphilales bacterium]